jgi:parallel beta-helix repeat protein
MRRRPTARRLHAESLESRLALTALFVSPLGNDSNSGTQSAPWRTLQKAANTVNPGDVVTVRAGDYVGFDLRRDGTSSAPITFKADPGANIVQRNATTSDGINLEGADYITIDGFTVNSMPRAGIRSVLNNHVTIRNNHTDSNYRWGIFTGFSDDLLIENNVTSRSQTEHGIYVSNSGDRPTIRDNTTFGNAGCGIHMNGDVTMGGDGIISGALVERNIAYDNGRSGGSAINADGVQNSRFQNNLLYNNHASGIALFRYDGGGPSSSNVLVNNTIVQAADARWALLVMNGATSNTIINNILYNNHSFRGSINISSDSLPGLVSDYNVLMDRITTNDGASVTTLPQWRIASSQDTHSLIATPSQLFVNSAGADYHLSTTSLAVDKGTSQSAPGNDLGQSPRPSGNSWDIGAYERQTISSNRAPIAQNDAVQIAEDTSVTFNVLANDSDPDGSTLSVANYTQPATGTVSRSGGQLRYTPPTNFSGQVSFRYQATDGLLLSNSATVVINVNAVNDAPVLNRSAAVVLDSVAEDASNPAGSLVSAMLGGVTDVDASDLRGIAVSGVTNSGGKWQYTLNGGITWNDFVGPTRSTARLLTANSSTRVRFLPQANFNGATDLFFIAWDQTQGAADDIVDLSSSGTTGGTTAFSAVAGRASLTVTPGTISSPLN